MAPANPVAGAPARNPVPCNIAPIDPNFRLGYVTTWTLGVQHAITSNLSLNLSYVGNHGTLLSGAVDLNQPIPGVKNSATAPQQIRRPYYGQFPYLGKILMYTDGDETNYNALQATISQRVWHGLTYNFYYTYSHGFEEGPFNSGTNQPMDSRHPELEYGNSSFDVRHHVAITFSYQLPGVKSPAQLLQGWQVHSSVNMLSGLPYNAFDSTSDLSGTGEALDRWTLAGTGNDFNGYGQRTHLPCFVAAGAPATDPFAAKATGCTVGLPAACSAAAAAEPVNTGVPSSDPNSTGTKSLGNLGCYMAGNSVIVPPAQGTFGSMRHNELRTVPFYQLDLSIDKLWRFNERVSAQFRAEGFNLMNSTHYALPSGNPAVPSTFGQSQSTPDVVNPVMGTGGARRIQFGLKFTF